MVDYILELKAQYDLTDYDLEFGYYYEIPYSDYPESLQKEINYAWSEIEKIEQKIRLIKEEYS